MNDYIKQRSKMFAAGLAGAITTALIKLAEQSFGFDINSEIEIMIVSAVAGFINSVVVYWAPANKPMEPKL
jgi:diaminopimelate decarboxylase